MRWIIAALALAAAPVARADDGTPVRLTEGEVLNLCEKGLAMCPVSTFTCDDPKVAVIQNGPQGAELKGVGPGTTVCSLLGPGQAFRRVFRVTVAPRADGQRRP